MQLSKSKPTILYDIGREFDKEYETSDANIVESNIKTMVEFYKEKYNDLSTDQCLILAKQFEYHCDRDWYETNKMSAIEADRRRR